MAAQFPIPVPSDIFSFMTILADALRFPEETLAMAFMYMNRYKKYYRNTEEIDYLDAHTLALASLSLSSKDTESPRRIREFLLPAYRLLHGASANNKPPLTFPSELYDTLRATIVQAELMLLRVLKFELRIPLPFEFLPRYLDRTLGELNSGGAGWGGTEDYDGMGKEQREEYKVVGLLETGIGRGCRGEVIRALQNYQLANFFPARTIAAACLYVTLQSKGLRVTQTVEVWLEEVTSGRVDAEDFYDVIAELERGKSPVTNS
ncbi:MAG: Cyclin- protein fam58a [Geoglossum umbratile]|nr:MAG: Cyclin- protein fam58a [Geoglossum umbratile]